MKTISAAFPLLAASALLAAACSIGGGAAASGATPAAPSGPRPTATPIAGDVATPEDAAALVIATDSRFAGVVKLNPNLIGASRWLESEPLAGGGFLINVTIGWGDCPAGCISRHVWTYTVTASGQLTLESEAGDPLPAGSLPNG